MSCTVITSSLLYLLQLALHAGHQHDAGHSYTQQQEEGVDQAGHCGVVPTGTTATQQAGGTATQAGDLHTHVITLIARQIDKCVCWCVSQ